VLSFFLDEKRNKKVKNERQLQSFSRSESLRNTTEKIVVRTVRSRQPHYYQRIAVTYAELKGSAPNNVYHAPIIIF
jgi:hypothetical protein